VSQFIWVTWLSDPDSSDNRLRILSWAPEVAVPCNPGMWVASMFCVGESGESPPNARANTLQLPPSTSSPKRELPSRTSPPALNVCLPFVHVIASVYVYNGVSSEILPLKRPPGASELSSG